MNMNVPLHMPREERIDRCHAELTDAHDAIRLGVARLHAALAVLEQDGDPGDAPAPMLALRDALRGGLALFDVATP